MIRKFFGGQGPPIIAILRGITPNEVEPVGRALVSAGIDAIEIPLNSPDPFKSIGLAVQEFGGEIPIGAGTVLSDAEVHKLSAIGAKLIVSPNTDRNVIMTAVGYGMITLPGAMTPTELIAAQSAGATGAKIFPARGLGLAFVGDVKSVLPADFPLVAVGGVDASNVNDWVAAGVDGLGVGSSVYRPGDSAGTVLQKAKALISAIKIT